MFTNGFLHRETLLKISNIATIVFPFSVLHLYLLLWKLDPLTSALLQPINQSVCLTDSRPV